jgi:hypothetical protein
MLGARGALDVRSRKISNVRKGGHQTDDQNLLSELLRASKGNETFGPGCISLQFPASDFTENGRVHA